MTAEAEIAGAESACAAGVCEETIGFLEEAVRRRPGDLRLHYWLGLCYAGGCRPHALVHPEMAVPYLRQALRLAPADSRARAAVLNQLANTVILDRTAARTEALRDAIDCHSQAAEIYQSLDLQEEWGSVEFNLGNSYCELSEATGDNHWREAIRHFELALRVRTRENDPERHAALLENLATAYRRLPQPDTARGTRMAILCCRRALPIYTLIRYPDQYAALQNNLGNAFLTLTQVEEAGIVRNARRALRHFERALRVQSRDPHSRAFGITQHNRAQAYLLLARNSRTPNLALAAACLKAAAAAFTASGDDRHLRAVAALASAATVQ